MVCYFNWNARCLLVKWTEMHLLKCKSSMLNGFVCCLCSSILEAWIRLVNFVQNRLPKFIINTGTGVNTDVIQNATFFLIGWRECLFILAIEVCNDKKTFEQVHHSVTCSTRHCCSGSGIAYTDVLIDACEYVCDLFILISVDERRVIIIAL